jgi:hypothetical protein
MDRFIAVNTKILFKQRICGIFGGHAVVLLVVALCYIVSDEVTGIFGSPNPTGPTVTQPLTEMSTRNLAGW